MAQQRLMLSLQGVIRAAETGKPLEGVYVGSPTLNRWAISDAKGRFVLPNFPTAAVELTATLLGYEPVRIPLDASAGQQPLVITLRQQSLALAEVRVVAKEQALGSGSMIGRQAIQHVQPVSLADVLQLVPGQLAINPDLSNVQQSLLRQAPTSTAADRMNALGTALILDGVPLSNNANLQSDVTILNASAGSLPPFSSAVGRGNDLRQIPADNIESVEVIRGIPSVRFGDLTTGGVLVTTRAGVYSPRLTQRLNPNLSQTAFGYGFRAANTGTFNIDTDLAF
ncbi:TonB-dependent receptor plug domain-containing protein [Larkinella punicea]|nr:TonB-dependent receptor plug domain-containing protein [Larkinella punicea]